MKAHSTDAHLPHEKSVCHAFDAAFGLGIGLEASTTMTPSGITTSIDWGVPLVGISGFAGVGYAGVTCGPGRRNR